MPSKGSLTYQTERLSKIPSMASAISKKIAKFRQDYNKLVDDAKVFFTEYQNQQAKIAQLNKLKQAYKQQIDVIENYRQKHGKLPRIKNQDSTENYLIKLCTLHKKTGNELKDLELTIRNANSLRYEMLDHLVDQMLDLLNGRKIFSQFLGTIALSAPSPDDKVRHIQNEKNKPIFITALTIAFFEALRRQNKISHPYVKVKLHEIFADGDHAKYSLMADSQTESQTMPAGIKMHYREEILKPLAKASLLQSIGVHSPEVDTILGKDKYRVLENETRNELVKVQREKSIDYIKLGIGIVHQRFDTKEQRDKYLKFESKILSFILYIENSLSNSNDSLGDALRIPMVYTSIILSTKPEFDYQQIYQAYDILQNGAHAQAYRSDYVAIFLQMVGRFPLGSGIYFVQHETGEIERAIVSSLYPSNVDEPICKQVTRRQLQFISQAEIIVSQESNLFFAKSREISHYTENYLRTKLPNGYIWNAAELWEVQIPALNFWKKDGSVKYNAFYQSLGDKHD
ncbi:hypothetical protein [Catenovulum sediminis]|uniref:Uncharacterized protein n=1 Tax=Catenovulum sediminis TaxID=1740262 RepID=A0ABV1RHW0_9ALTE